MNRLVAGACILAATIAAAPPPAPSPNALAGRSASVVCDRAPLFLWQRNSSIPTRTGRTNDAALGQRFTIVRGPRTTPDSRRFYELDIPIVEPGYGPDDHYWIDVDCVSVGSAPTPAPSASP